MTTTPEILVFGATSLVGSHFVAQSPSRIHASGRQDPREHALPVAGFDRIDLGAPADVEAAVRASPASVVVNFAARTDVDGIERERASGSADGGPAWEVNALAPEAMARAAAATGKFLVHLSTDFVYDGEAGPYAEATPTSPLSPKISWYGWTKSEGERRVRSADPRSAVLRIAFPYRSRFPAKLDFARWMVDRARRGDLPPLFSDQQITPTWVPDVARALEALLQRRPSGVFHLASPETTTPYEFGRELIRSLVPGAPEPRPGTMAAMARDPARAPRPQHGGLRCQRIQELGVRPTGWRDGVHRLAQEEGAT